MEKQILIISVFIVGIIIFSMMNRSENFQELPDYSNTTGYCGKSKDFCPRGYCNGDIPKERENTKDIVSKFPANKKNYCLGYDNPYIYPYNYDINYNHPVSKFKFPSWIRQIDLDVNDQYGFPGYAY